MSGRKSLSNAEPVCPRKGRSKSAPTNTISSSMVSDDVTSSKRTPPKNTRAKPGRSRYVGILDAHNIRIDSTGSGMCPEVREMVDKTLLKQRSQPALEATALQQTVKEIDKVGQSTESVVAKMLKTPMFPDDRDGIAYGGGSLWSRSALSKKANRGQRMSQPKPDEHIGYSQGATSVFSRQQSVVISDPELEDCFYLGSGNVLPFLIFEMKSEMTGGTIYEAEHQAAGSGTLAVKSMRRLHEEAGVDSTTTDSIAFSVAATARHVALYVNWYHLKEERHYMSKVKEFLPSRTEEVQACRHMLENVLDWGLGSRLAKIKQSLDKLGGYGSQGPDSLGPPLWAMNLDGSTVLDSDIESSATEDSSTGESSFNESDTDNSEPNISCNKELPASLNSSSLTLMSGSASESKASRRYRNTTTEQTSPTQVSRKQPRNSLPNLSSDPTTTRRITRAASAQQRKIVTAN